MAVNQSTHTAEGMAAAESSLASAVTDLQGFRSQLLAAYDQLQGGWAGPAQSSFGAAYTALDADYAKIINAAQNLQEAMGANKTTYLADEETNVGLGKRVPFGGALNGSVFT